MTALIKYEAARQALAECRRVDEAKEILDKSIALKAYARQAKDHELEADAAEIRERATRRLGELLVAAKAAGQLRKGRVWENSNGSETEPLERVTLAEAGIDKKLSSQAQKKASISERAFEAMVDNMRERMLAGRQGGAINGARAVAATRVEAEDSLDYFPTPPWATRALLEHAFPRLGVTSIASAWEPACGEGHIAEVLREYCAQVSYSDVHDYGYGLTGELDFLETDAPIAAEWIITNPPFGDKSIPFVKRALELAPNVAMFFRSQWAVEGLERYEEIFRATPPTLVSFFVERVPLCKGRWDPDGTTATAYCWLVWAHERPPLPTFWIPPGCRERLSLPDDRAKFTKHPVTWCETLAPPAPAALPPHDPTTGEILVDGTPIDAIPGVVIHRQGDSDDALDVPQFLRRTWRKVFT